jgi:hypothetical protein
MWCKFLRREASLSQVCVSYPRLGIQLIEKYYLTMIAFLKKELPLMNEA